MGRLAWSQLRFRAGRTLALLVGMLLAATAFTVLTATSRTAQLRTIGTVSASFSPAYDILVRPAGSRTALENRTGTVQPDFLSGSYGGITMAQYHQIQQIPGVQVAAPVAMVGYTMILADTQVTLPTADYALPGRQLYRVTTTWVTAGGTNRITQPPSFVYVTPDRIHVDQDTGVGTESLPGGSSVPVCVQNADGATVTTPFSMSAQSASYCWSKTGGLSGSYLEPGKPGQAYAYVAWELPMLVAAVDPDAEARLDGLNHAIMSGRYLREAEADGRSTAGGRPAPGQPTVPVLATSGIGIGEEAVTQVQRLAAPASAPSLDPAMMAREATAPGRTVLTSKVSAQQAYQAMFRDTRNRPGLDTIDNMWTVGPVRYRRDGNGSLTPVPVTNPASVWQLTSLAGDGVLAVPMDEEDAQYRSVQSHLSSGSPDGTPLPLARLVGVFNPARVKTFSPLSKVPLGPYQAVTAAPANQASRTALHGGGLLPSLNVGGYVGQPVQLITSLDALPALENGAAFSGNLHARDPISVIRVRVAGITGPNALSRERINEVAQQIATGTGLDVDIVAGSSPEPVTVQVPAGRYGQPRLAVTEGWVQKGVAVAILAALDKKSVTLFTLILVVCVLFVANAATAAVRGRRRELGVLASLGWRRSRLFAAVLGELAGIGLAAGLLGAAVALPLSAALGLRASPGRALLAVPVAVAVAVIGGLAPAWLAARTDPVTAVRPPVLAVRRGHQPRGITTLALINVGRAPGRTLIGVLSLAVGMAALMLLTAVTFAFRGVLVGSLLGDAVAVQVRGADYVAVGATVGLGVLAVADVLYLNIRERAAELATLRSFGWGDSALARLVVTEGAAIGIAGSVIGAGLGLAATAVFGGQFPARLLAVAVLATAAGIVITALAALLPAGLVRRLPAAILLAEE
jgi:putative ABC transport system permease protein